MARKKDAKVNTLIMYEDAHNSKGGIYKVSYVQNFIAKVRCDYCAACMTFLCQDYMRKDKRDVIFILIRRFKGGTRDKT